MAWFGSVLGWERTVMDGEHRLLEPGPASFDTLLGAAVVSARPQRGSSVWSQRCRTQQRRSRLVDGLIDALGTQPHARLLGKASAQVAADLLRTPSLRQKLGHHQSERWNGFETSPVIAGSSCGRVAVGVERRQTPVVVALRRNSREIVDGARPSRHAICRMLRPAWRRSASSIRSSCDKNLALIRRTASRSRGGTKPTSCPRR